MLLFMLKIQSFLHRQLSQAINIQDVAAVNSLASLLHREWRAALESSSIHFVNALQEIRLKTQEADPNRILHYVDHFLGRIASSNVTSVFDPLKEARDAYKAQHPRSGRKGLFPLISNPSNTTHTWFDLESQASFKRLMSMPLVSEAFPAASQSASEQFHWTLAAFEPKGPLSFSKLYKKPLFEMAKDFTQKPSLDPHDRNVGNKRAMEKLIRKQAIKLTEPQIPYHLSMHLMLDEFHSVLGNYNRSPELLSTLKSFYQDFLKKAQPASIISEFGFHPQALMVNSDQPPCYQPLSSEPSGFEPLSPFLIEKLFSFAKTHLSPVALDAAMEWRVPEKTPKLFHQLTERLSSEHQIPDLFKCFEVVLNHPHPDLFLNDNIFECIDWSFVVALVKQTGQKHPQASAALIYWLHDLSPDLLNYMTHHSCERGSAFDPFRHTSNLFESVVACELDTALEALIATKVSPSANDRLSYCMGQLYPYGVSAAIRDQADLSSVEDPNGQWDFSSGRSGYYFSSYPMYLSDKHKNNQQLITQMLMAAKESRILTQVLASQATALNAHGSEVLSQEASICSQADFGPLTPSKKPSKRI